MSQVIENQAVNTENNLFGFEYKESPLFNQDGTKSNFRQVFGRDGKNVVCPKGTYHIVKTNDVSALGNAFISKGYKVSTFDHRNGESIGLNVSFGSKPSKVGDSTYNLIITVPNNGAGKGFLSIKQLRLICSNGMVSNKTMHKDNYIKIPHTVDYKDSLILMEQSIGGFLSLLEQVQNRDMFLDGQKLTDIEVMFNLNKWYFENDMPKSCKFMDADKKVPMTLNDFRMLLATKPKSIKNYKRYLELKTAYTTEIEYNKELGLDLSMYTVYASVTNYLSRRVEKSTSTTTEEVKLVSASKKLEFFNVEAK